MCALHIHIAHTHMCGLHIHIHIAHTHHTHMCTVFTTRMNTYSHTLDQWSNCETSNYAAVNQRTDSICAWLLFAFAASDFETRILKLRHNFNHLLRTATYGTILTATYFNCYIHQWRHHFNHILPTATCILSSSKLHFTAKFCFLVNNIKRMIIAIIHQQKGMIRI